MGKSDSYNTITTFILENRVPIYRLAYSYVHNKENALNIIQDSICKALTSIQFLKNEERVKLWFYRILVNTAIDFIRKNKKYVYLEADMLEAEVSGSYDSYQEFDLRNIIDRLSITNKTIILLRFYEGLELGEISIQYQFSIDLLYQFSIVP